MISPTHSAASLFQTGYSSVGQVGNMAQPQAQEKSGYGDAVTVTLSPAAESAQKLGSVIPRFTIDPEFHMQRAEVALKDLMARLGIPESTEIQIEVQADGDISATGDHPLVSQIEETLNGEGADQYLRSALIFARNGSIMMRIGEASELASNGADKRPDMTEYYFDWVKSVASHAQNSSYSANFSNDRLTGFLVNHTGNTQEALSELSLPA